MAAAIRTLQIFAGTRILPHVGRFPFCPQTRHFTFLSHPKLHSVSDRVLLPVDPSPIHTGLVSYSTALISSHLGSNAELLKPISANPLFLSCLLPNQTQLEQRRSVVKFSLRKGKRKTVKAVIRRFFRLRWGGWIRPRSGRAKRLWKKSPQRRARLRKHVFCNSTQNQMLDIMVTRYWKRPRYYVDDPYEPYHKRHNIYPYKQ